MYFGFDMCIVVLLALEPDDNNRNFYTERSGGDGVTDLIGSKRDSAAMKPKEE